MSRDWTLRAACTRLEPDDRDLLYGTPDEQRHAARTWCATCPVQLDCLDDALNVETHAAHTHGVRGGFTETQRRALRTRRTA